MIAPRGAGASPKFGPLRPPPGYDGSSWRAWTFPGRVRAILGGMLAGGGPGGRPGPNSPPPARIRARMAKPARRVHAGGPNLAGGRRRAVSGGAAGRTWRAGHHGHWRGARVRGAAPVRAGHPGRLRDRRARGGSRPAPSSTGRGSGETLAGPSSRLAGGRGRVAWSGAQSGRAGGSGRLSNTGSAGRGPNSPRWPSSGSVRDWPGGLVRGA